MKKEFENEPVEDRDFEKEYEEKFGNSNVMTEEKDWNKSFDKSGEKENIKKEKIKKEKNKGTGLKIYAALLTLIVVELVVSTYYFYNKSKNSRKVIQYVKVGDDIDNNINTGLDDEDGLRRTLKSSIEAGVPMIEILRDLYPEEIVVYSSNQFDFIPVIEGLKKNDIDNENIVVADNGQITYEKDGKKISHKGIDVSKFQGDIDWNKVAADGVEFAIVRVGFRGYGSGQIVEDEKAKANLEGAKKAGIKLGVYFFSQAVTEAEAVEEAKYVVSMIKDYNIEYPVFFDTEEIPDADERAEGLSKEELTDIAVAFCEVIKKEGYTPGIYANLRWFSGALNLEKLEDYYKWYAYYDSNLYFPYKIHMWQYSETGKVDGITGTVDMNISFGDWD